MSMEVERPKLKEEPHLSGARIRSLIKQLSSSKSKTPINPKSPNRAIGDGLPQELAHEHTECISDVQQQQSPPPPPQSRPRKKQVRRRLHTNKPHRERILNMAEARREIVAALKLHRATMKRATEEQQRNHQQQKQNSTPPCTPCPPVPTLEEPHQEWTDSRRNARIYPPNYTHPSYHQDPSFSSFVSPSSAWAYPTIPPLSIADNLNLPLPNKPLGLNLNIQGFNNIGMPFCSSNTNNPPIQPSLSPPPSSCSSYSDSSPPTVLGLEVPFVSDVAPHASDVASDPLHPEMDDEEMAKIHSIGEQYDIEWNDMMNLFASVWWSEFLKNMEGSLDERMTRAEVDGFHVFDEFLVDTPSWLSDGYVGDAKDGCLLQQQQQTDDHYRAEDYLKDATLPCWDIGDIESWDAEWLS